MAEPRRGLTAEERFAALQRDRAVLRRERLLREVAGPRWHRMMRIIPVLFRREGTLVVRTLLTEPAAVAEALREDAVFALDTAMRLAHGHGFLAIREVQAYLTTPEPLNSRQPDRDSRGFHGKVRRLGDRGGGRNRRTDSRCFDRPPFPKYEDRSCEAGPQHRGRTHLF